MAVVSRLALVLALGLGVGGGLAMPASAAPPMPAAASVQGAAVEGGSPLLQDVRWVRSCRNERVVRRDRFGHRRVMSRQVCRRVWR
ncbi:hypothetical protein [Roseomonas elaeocarpi]|uniref:Uncharacterized protein n=1 Tax=Roseomonas elaeocarpi TaxID=907779 RepID=A0ABV6JRY7_9PROT